MSVQMVAECCPGLEVRVRLVTLSPAVPDVAPYETDGVFRVTPLAPPVTLMVGVPVTLEVRIAPLPPAPPPPPASLGVVLVAAAPFAVIVAVPVRFPARIMTIPPPAAALLVRLLLLLLLLPAPPPPPSTTRLMLTGNAVPPNPPVVRLEFQVSPP